MKVPPTEITVFPFSSIARPAGLKTMADPSAQGAATAAPARAMAQVLCSLTLKPWAEACAGRKARVARDPMAIQTWNRRIGDAPRRGMRIWGDVDYGGESSQV